MSVLFLALLIACTGHPAPVEPAAETLPPAEAVAPPGGREAATIPYADAEFLGPMDREVFDAVMAEHIGEVKRCYQVGLWRDPELEGRLLVKFVISSSGRVTSSATQSSTLGDEAVEDCIHRAMLGFVSPEVQGGGIVIVRYPFELHPV